MPTCKIKNQPMRHKDSYRTKDGDIKSDYYCYSDGGRGNQKRLVHPQCKENQRVLYENGKGYNLSKRVSKENLYPNLIKCWCQPNVKSTNNFPHDLQQHNLRNKQIMSIGNLHNPKID